VPGATHRYLEWFAPVEPAIRVAERLWSRVFKPRGDQFPWVIFEAMLFGVSFSGPPLIGANLTRHIASRCVAKLPTWRWRVLTGLVSLAFALLIRTNVVLEDNIAVRISLPNTWPTGFSPGQRMRSARCPEGRSRQAAGGPAAATLARLGDLLPQGVRASVLVAIGVRFSKQKN
jgi:hypothetical protein